ncbi:MAG: hypothetical protein ACLGSD_00635 [Acidobacteriota bacterium]
MPAEFQSIPFDPADPRAALHQLPRECAVFALYGEAANAEPYIGRTPNLRGRLERLLIPSPKHPRRLQLAGRVRRIEWRVTGSDFESLLLQFDLLQKVYGPKALERMHLGAPSFVRFLGSNPYPRVTVTNRPSLKEADWAYGPFASRAAAERFCDEMLKLFLLRRCTDDLSPDPSHPGCVYSEMKMCLAPCYKGCTDERYAEESAAVQQFLSTRGDSRLVQLRTRRDEASSNLEFENAAALHALVQKVEGVRTLAPEIVRPLSQLRAVILQAAAPPAVGPTAPSAPSLEALAIADAASHPTAPGTSAEANSSAPPRDLFENQDPSAAHPTAPEAQRSLAPRFSVGNGAFQDSPESRRDGAATPPPREPSAPEIAIFLYQNGKLCGPATFSTLGMRIQNEQSGSSSLFAQPMALEAIPESREQRNEGTREQEGSNERSASAIAAQRKSARNLLETRLESVLAELSTDDTPPDAAQRQGHLALLKRWYYRPEVKRPGEIFFPDADGQWPIRAILRGAGRIAAKSLTSTTAS